MLFWYGGQRAWLTDRLCSCFEHIVPVVGGRAKALDAGVQSNHGVRHLVAGGIGVKAAIDLRSLIQQGLEPSWVGPGAGGGETTGLGMESKATEGIDGGFTKDDRLAGGHGGWERFSRNGKAAEVLLRPGGQAVPRARGGAAQLRSHRNVFFSKQQENGIGSGVGIEGA